MPGQTQFIRKDGSPESLRWGLWHRQMFRVAIADENGCDIQATEQIYDEPANTIIKEKLESVGFYKFGQDHAFKDPADGEILEIHEGDTYIESWSRFHPKD